MIFGSLLILESNGGGPQLPMAWGRRQADCRNPFKNIDIPSHLDPRRIAKAGASLSSFGKPEEIFKEFANLGMSKAEAVALMGAHSFGKLHYYTGGPRTRNKGAGFCTSLKKIRGFFSDGRKMRSLANDGVDHLDPNSSPPGACIDGTETAEGALSCWTNERGYLEPARNDSAVNYVLNKFPELLKKSKGNMKDATTMLQSSWGGGGFFDRTPDRFDNDYFKLLAETDPRERMNCCGPSTEFGCSTDGFPMQNKQGREIEGCDVNFCLRSAGQTTGSLGGGSPKATTEFPDYAALSTRIYVQSKLGQHEFNGVHHIYLLAADWALIDDKKARKVVKKFAKSEKTFLKAFAKVWSKTINLGYRSGVLQTCEAPKS